MSLKPINSSVTVTTAGTRVQCTATKYLTPFAYVEALRTNTGDIYVGISTVTSTLYIAKLTAGESVSIDSEWFGRSQGEKLDASAVWIDSSVSGEKALFTILQKQDND